MKRIFILVSLFGLWSCSTDLDETLEQRQQVLTQQATDASHRVSQVELCNVPLGCWAVRRHVRLRTCG